MATQAAAENRLKSTGVSIPTDRLWRISVDTYHKMIADGTLTEDDPVELLDGYLVSKMPRDPLHDTAITQLQEQLTELIAKKWTIRVQCAVTTDDSEPEPDFAIVSPPASRYGRRHPGTGDVALIIEVANSSLDVDQKVKGPLYARAKFPIYWIVNIPMNHVEVYSRITKSARYQAPTIYTVNDEIPLVLNGKKLGEIPVGSFLSPE